MISVEAMQKLEREALSQGAEEESLMEKAGVGIAKAITRRVGKRERIHAFIGKGHNAGDALVVLRHLFEEGWKVSLTSAYPTKEWRALLQKKWLELGSPEVICTVPVLPRGTVLLDGLLGLGACGPLRSPLSELVKKLNETRIKTGGITISLDIPSGIDGNTGEKRGEAVIADLTIAVASPKQGLVADCATEFVGALDLVTLSELPEPKLGDKLITRKRLFNILPRRKYNSHKGTVGRAALIAGSQGLTGAARLCAMGALRGGAGLVTLFVPEGIYKIVAPSIAPEAMVHPYKSMAEIELQGFDSLAVGPGLGAGDGGSEDASLLNILKNFEGQGVLDADGLNRVASMRTSWNGGNFIFTPHPGEMSRINNNFTGTRVEVARFFTEQSPKATLLYKGARSIITQKGEPIFYNSTGDPAMASGGQGDVLSGLLAALLAQGLTPLDAAKAGAWLAGRASELACQKQEINETSLLATDTANHLGMALEELRGTSGNQN